MKNTTNGNPVKKWAIVDDQPAVLEVMQALLATIPTGEVVAFNDPLKAIAAIRAEPHAFEMLITDRNMPHMDGVGLLVLAREVAPHLRFVMVTGNTLHLENDLDRFDLPHSFISKPFNRTRIVEAVGQAAILGAVPEKSFAAPAGAVRNPRERRTVHSTLERVIRFATIALTCSIAGMANAHDVDAAIEHASFRPAGSSSERANEVSIEVINGFRVIRANGIPDHATGRFPNGGNPNALSPQDHVFRVTLHPQPAAQPTAAGPAFFGVAINGVPFEAGTAEYWQGDRRSGWNYEALSGRINLGMDQNNAHVQPTGAYHYHALPTGLLTNLNENGHSMVLVGWAADGFPVYSGYGHSDPKDTSSAVRKMTSSYRLKTGTRRSGPGGSYDGRFTEDYEYRAGSGDLDECNGHFGVTPEFPEGTYHYHITEMFPYIARQWKGVPDPSFMKRGGPGPSERRLHRGTGPGPRAEDRLWREG